MKAHHELVELSRPKRPRWRTRDEAARRASFGRALVAALVVVLAACGGPSFDSPSIVLGPRILAAVADPPELAPGTDVRVTVMTAEAEGATLELTVDLSVAALALGAGQHLGEDAEPIALVPDGDAWILPAAATESAIDALFDVVGDAPPETPEHVVRFVYETVGLPVRIDITMRDADGEVILEAFKRVVLTSRGSPTTNPPPPRFRVGDAWASGTGEAFRCGWEGAPAIVAPGDAVTLVPDPDEPWLESFPVLDLEGEVITGTEAAYYSWFSTAGDFDFDVTRSPGRETEWTAPETTGARPLWVVVRDGHLGVSACRVDVEVR